MGLLNTATDVRMGTTQVQRIYRGTNLVWEHEIASAITLTASKTQSNSGDPVTLTATVQGTTNGTIQFREGSTSGTIIDTDSASPWTTVVNPTSDTTYYAEFLGDDPYLPGFSAGVTISVAETTTVALVASPSTINPSGSSTLTATVNGGAVTTGTIRFRSGSSSGPIIATVTDAPWTTTVSPTSDVTYYAEYVGNDQNVGAVSPGALVDYQIPTSISLAVSSSSVNAGQSVTLTATVTGASSGTVRFRKDSPSGTIVATDTSAPWSASVTPTADTTYYAEYVANGDYEGSVSTGKTVQYSVPTSVSLSANPTSVPAGSSVTLTATTSGIPNGHTISFRAGSTSGTVVGSGTVSSGVASASVVPGADTTYYATYAGSGDYLASNSNGVFVDRYIATSVSLSGGGTINNGQSKTLTATVSGASTGTVQFRAGSPTGTVVGTVAVSGGTASLGVSPTSSTTYYASYLANGDYLGSTSGAQTVTVRQLVTKTWSGNSDWSQSYQGDKSQRSTSYLYYGYYSSSWGNQRSLIGFNVPDLSGVVEVTKVRLKFYNVHHYMNSGGDINVALHDYTTKPTTWDSARVDNNEYTVGSAPKPGWVDFNFGATVRNKFKNNGIKGVGLGPGVTTSTNYYGYAANHASSTVPWLQIQYTVWE